MYCLKQLIIRYKDGFFKDAIYNYKFVSAYDSIETSIEKVKRMMEDENEEK